MNKPAELPVPGDLFQGKYRIERLLGKGGMGAVFSAQHEGLGQRVAVKFLLAEAAANEEANARFRQEARAAANILNEHVARVVDVDVSGASGLQYMVMEYLEGLDLSQLLETRSSLPPDEACGYLLQAADAIHAAHKLGIIHRDLKPSNLFLATKPDGSKIVKVLDFGISKAQNSLGPMSGALTSTKAMLGSPLYMSPEQLRSSKSVDVRADIWALGVILYELLTGAVPYNGENLGELFAAILEQDPLPVRQRAPHVSPELEAVVMRCLQRQPQHRFATVAELAAHLAPFAPAYAHLPVVAVGRAQAPNGPAPIPQGAGFTQPISQAGYLPQAPMRPSHASVPAFGANTGNPVNVPVAAAAAIGSGGFVAQPQGISGAELLPEGSSVAGVPSRGSNTGIFVGIGAFLLLVTVGIGAYTVVGKKSSGGAGTASSASASAEVPVAKVSAPLPTPSAAPTAEAPSSTAAATAPPPPPSATAVAVVPKTPTPPPQGGKKPPVAPPATAPATAPATPPPPATAAPTPKPTSTLQTSR